MNGSHLSADQALDMSAEMWLAARSPNDLYAFIPARALEGATPKISTVVDMDAFGQPGYGPSFLDLAFPKPRRLVEHRMQYAEARRQS